MAVATVEPVPLLAAPAAADGVSATVAPSETRVRGIDLVGGAGIWDTTLASAGSRWASTYSYGELAADRPEHMNGRVYDYRLGRFLSVDPIISDPANSQSINPYSYIGNNPLSGVDPTGYAGDCQTVTGSHVCNANPIGNVTINGSHISNNVVSGPATQKSPASTGNGATPQGTRAPTANPVEHGSPQDTAKADSDRPKEWPHSVVGTEEWTKAWAATHGGSVVAPQPGDKVTLAGQSWEFGKSPEQDAIFIKYYLHLANQQEDSAVINAAMLAAGGIRALGALLDAVTAARTASSGAESAANGLRLGKQLASESQSGELTSGGGQPIAGAGARKPIDDIARLTKEYGGRSGDWVKVRSWNYKAADGTSFETHAYRNTRTGEVVELKTKFQ